MIFIENIKIIPPLKMNSAFEDKLGCHSKIIDCNIFNYSN
jgi:hypothetical protein